MLRHASIRLCVLLVIFLTLISAAGCQTDPTGKRVLVLISRDQEISLGEEAAPEFEKEFGGRVPNEQLQSYVSMIGGKVAAVSDRDMPYEYTLVASDVPNAFALPGGKIFITAGLMRLMNNERELAAVLGHETGHVAAFHSVQGMQRQMGAQVLIDLAGRAAGKGEGAAEAAAQVVTTMANLKYSRDDEYGADVLGVKYMTRAGYNPWGMVELLTILLNLQEDEPGKIGEMLQTHPVSSKRIANTEEIIGNNDEYRSFSPNASDPHVDRFAEMHRLLIETMGVGD